jgi:hypothetical protein
MNFNQLSRFTGAQVAKLRSYLYEHLAGGNQVTAMQNPASQEGDDSRVSIWRNIRPIPNVSSFRINARVFDQFLVKFGLLRKTGGSVEIIPYRNRDINRYVEHQLRRMASASDVLF